MHDYPLVHRGGLPQGISYSKSGRGSSLTVSGPRKARKERLADYHQLLQWNIGHLQEPPKGEAQALAASMLVGSIWLWNADATTSRPAGYDFEQPAIAVMPFRNSTGSPVNDGLAAVLTEDLTTDLARLREIDVIS